MKDTNQLNTSTHSQQDYYYPQSRRFLRDRAFLAPNDLSVDHNEDNIPPSPLPSSHLSLEDQLGLSRQRGLSQAASWQQPRWVVAKAVRRGYTRGAERKE